MDTSVTIIGLAITLLIGIPLFYMFRSHAANNSKIKAIFARYGNFNFTETDQQNKKVLALDKNNKGFLFIDFNSTPEEIQFVNLNDVDAVKTVSTKDASSNNVVKIEFEFQHKQHKKENVPFYTIENDQIGQVYLYQDQQLSKKWEKLLTNAILS